MSNESSGNGTPRRRWVAPSMVLAMSVGLLSACSGSDGPPLSPQAAEGREIVRQSGCAACHGRNGTGGAGPSWVGIYGGTERLEDGGEVVVDDAYLRRSIIDPDLDRVAGYNVVMPDNNLTDEQITAVVAYIQELA